MPEWLHDLRYGARMIVKRPGTSAIAIVALALGIGLTTTMFSIVQGVILRGLPFEDSGRIMTVSRTPVQGPRQRDAVPLHDFVDFRVRQTSLESLAAYTGAPAIVAGDTALPERLRGVRVTPNLMRVLRVAPILGRDLSESDAAPGAPAVALISYRQWQSRFQGRGEAIGAVIRLNGAPATVVGVMPEKFGFPESEDIWMPQPTALPSTRDEGARLEVIGRLRDGVTVERTTAEFAAIARQLTETVPENKDITAHVERFADVARVDVNAVLKDDTRGATSVRMGRFGRGLVVVEVTVSCVLLVVSGLMIRSILASSRMDYPFATRDVFFAQTRLDERLYADMPAVRRAAEKLDAQLARVPGVRRAALATSVPGSAGSPSLSLEGVVYARPEDRPRARRTAATPGYFDVLGVQVRAGRLFTAADTDGATPVAVVDEAFVARHVSPGPALGRRIRFGDEKQPWLTVVGVVPSLVQPTDDDQIVESVYVPFAQAPDRGFSVLARAAGDPLALGPTMRATVARGFHDTPLVNVNSLAGELWRGGWAVRLFGGLFLLFGGAALLLAAAGLYGVMSFTVRRRTQEIGVRMALGATQRGVLGLVLRQGLWRVALGIALGLLPGWYLATLMQALLNGVSPTDPLVYATTATTLLTAGTLATLVPAIRASAVDPLTALRRE